MNKLFESFLSTKYYKMQTKRIEDVLSMFESAELVAIATSPQQVKDAIIKNAIKRYISRK